MTFLQFINYFKTRDNVSQGLDFLCYVESGIILVVSAALGLIISIYLLLFMTEPSEVPSWSPMDDRGLIFLMLFCAAIQSFYQIYLTRKLNKIAVALKDSK
jgi:ABC-type antimicrobial peptide transport system permease subunit